MDNSFTSSPYVLHRTGDNPVCRRELHRDTAGHLGPGCVRSGRDGVETRATRRERGDDRGSAAGGRRRASPNSAKRPEHNTYKQSKD